MTEFWRQFLAILPVYVLQFCYGMSGAYPSVTTPELTMDCALFSITPNQESNIGKDKTSTFSGSLNLSFPVSIDNIISPIICILSGSLQQKFGPRTILLLNCLPYLLAWIGAALSGVYKNVWFLYISRCCHFNVVLEINPLSLSGYVRVLAMVFSPPQSTQWR